MWFTGSFCYATGVHTNRVANKNPCSRTSLSGFRLDVLDMNTDSSVCDQNSRTSTLCRHWVSVWYPRGEGEQQVFWGARLSLHLPPWLSGGGGVGGVNPFVRVVFTADVRSGRWSSKRWRGSTLLWRESVQDVRSQNTKI